MVAAVASGEDGGRAVKSRIRTRRRRSRMTLPVRVSPSISLAPFFPFYLLVLLFFHPRHPGLRSLWPIVTERKKVSRVERERESCVTATPCYANVIQAACAHVRTHARHPCTRCSPRAKRGNGVNGRSSSINAFFRVFASV